MSIAKFRKFSAIIFYVIFQPCYLSSFLPHWTCSDPRRGKCVAPHYCWVVFGIMVPHMISSKTIGDGFHYQPAGLKVPYSAFAQCQKLMLST